MKHYFFALSVLTLSALSANAVNVPYESTIADFDTKKLAEDWTLVDANKDNKTWYVDNDDNKFTEVTGCKIGLIYQYHELNDADDWLFSPMFNLKGGVEYSIKYWIKESNANNEKFEVLVGPSTVPADYATATPIKSYDKNIGTTWRHEEAKFTPETTGEYRVALHICSEKYMNKLYLRGFSIKDNITYPAAPSNFSVTPAPDKTLKATLTWEVPTTDSEGNPLSKNITGFNIHRNEELIATIDGDKTEYVDESVPEPGTYKYEISALIDDAEGFSTSVLSKWIGILTAQTLPFTETFSDPDFYETFWATLDVENDAKKNNNSTYPPLSNAWCFMSNMMGNAHCAVMYSSRNSNVTDDDWLFSAPLAFPAKGKYKLSFKTSTYGTNVATNDYNVTVCAGKGNTPEAMDIEIANINTLNKNVMNPNTDGELHEYEFNVDSAGAYYIGFHSQTIATYLEHQFRMGAFSVEVVELQGEEAMVPPYRSESDENWTDTKELTFILMPGYYHASWTTDGDVSVDDFMLDQEFSEEYAILKVTEEGNATFKSTENFTSFEILDVNHTPAAVEDFSYYENENGNIIFSFTAPVLNVDGSKLYEVEGATIYEGAVEIASLNEVKPGEVVKYTHSNPAQMRTRASDLGYSLVLHNISGESEPVAATLNTNTGILNIETSDSAAHLFNIDGTEVEKANLAPGLYIEVKNGKATKLIVK